MLRGQLKVFPNPATTAFVVSWPLLVRVPAHLEVINSAGQKVLSESLQDPDIRGGQLKLSTTQWPAGMFYIKLISKEYTFSGKVSVIH